MESNIASADEKWEASSKALEAIFFSLIFPDIKVALIGRIVWDNAGIRKYNKSLPCS